MLRHRLVLASLVAVAFGTTVAFASTASAAPPASSDQQSTMRFGERKRVGDGVMCSWVRCDTDGKPLAIGVTFTEGVLSGLPDTLPTTEYALSLPPEAAATAFTHFAANWNPKGHIPEGVYDMPHFDFHFYIISPEVRAQITATGDDLARVLKTPPTGCLPDGYITAPGASEPHMGNHWIDAASPELHGKRFTTTLVYGSYDGKLAFVEPMMTKAFLEAKPSFISPIKLPAKYLTRAYYPTRYSVSYGGARRRYTVALEGLTLR